MDAVTSIDEAFPEGGDPPVLRLRLGACRLQVRPGDDDPWVRGTYRDPGGEEPLRVERDGSELVLRQHRSVAATVGLLHGAPVCELELGSARAFALHLDTGASDVSLDLTGRPLNGLDLAAGAGRIDLRLSAPNPDSVERASFRLGAGTLTTHHLGNLAAHHLRVEGGAASLDLDLTGELRHPLDGRVATGMAGVTITVPADRPARITTDARLGGVDLGDGFLTRDGAITTPPDGEARVALHAAVALGTLRLRTA